MCYYYFRIIILCTVLSQYKYGSTLKPVGLNHILSTLKNWFFWYDNIGLILEFINYMFTIFIIQSWSLFSISSNVVSSRVLSSTILFRLLLSNTNIDINFEISTDTKLLFNLQIENSSIALYFDKVIFTSQISNSPLWHYNQTLGLSLSQNGVILFNTYKMCIFSRIINT